MNDPAERRKRAIILSLNEALVDEAHRDGPHLSATVEALLTKDVQRETAAQAERRQRADACTAGWNEVHARIGSFADEHTAL